MDLRIDWEAFHFLRPTVLWLILVIAVVAVLLWLADTRKSAWQKVIAPHLRPYVISKGSSALNRWIIVTFCLCGVLLALGLAGPTWKKIEIPGQVRQSVLLIALDMSQSMNATDISPSRLEHAKLKINDLIDQKVGIRTGLLGFAATPHLILPPTEDLNLVNFQSEYLTTSMMPEQGSDVVRMINYADTLLNAQPVPGTLLLITDEISTTQASYIQSYVQRSPHNIELWIIASREGSAARDSRKRIIKTSSGEDAMSTPDPNILNGLAQQERVDLQWITLDTSDAEKIAERLSLRLNVQESEDIKEDEWEDRGLALVWPAALFIVLWFRRGWVVQLSLIVSLMACSPTSEHADWWYSDDYRAQAFYENGDYEQAAALYTNSTDQGIAYYRAGDYEAAAALFQDDSTSTGKYRLSLALYQMGDYENAAQVLENIDGQSSPEAQALLQQIKQNLTEVDSVTRFANDPEKPKLDNEDPLNLREAKSKDEQLTSDTEVDELPQGGDRVADEVATDIRKARELDEPPEENEEGVEIDPSKILLQQTKADPTDFLRKRFRLQYRRYYQDIPKPETSW